jgi:hypothetical protein
MYAMMMVIFANNHNHLIRQDNYNNVNDKSHLNIYLNLLVKIYHIIHIYE